MSGLGIKAKRWWMKELKKMRQMANNKGRKASKYKNWPEHHSHAEGRESHKIFQKTMESTKRQHWRDWLEKADDPDIWTAHKYMINPTGDGGKTRIPVLKLTRWAGEHGLNQRRQKHHARIDLLSSQTTNGRRPAICLSQTSMHAECSGNISVLRTRKV